VDAEHDGLAARVADLLRRARGPEWEDEVIALLNSLPVREECGSVEIDLSSTETLRALAQLESAASYLCHHPDGIRTKQGTIMEACLLQFLRRSPNKHRALAVSRDASAQSDTGGVVGPVTVELVPGSDGVWTLPQSCRGVIANAWEAASGYLREVGAGIGDDHRVVVQILDPQEPGAVGPSVGLLIGVLIVAWAFGVRLDGHVVMTGELKADGSVAQVEGVTAKVDAAARAGFRHVLVPSRLAPADLPVLERRDLQVTPIAFLREAVRTVFPFEWAEAYVREIGREEGDGSW
jgi:hypothetical protein